MGEFILFLGGMFAGKTTYMLVEFLRRTYKKKGIIIKHSFDDRNENMYTVQTHNGNITVDAVEVKDSKDILKEVGDDVDVVAIDELHFFDDVRSVVEKLMLLGKTVLASGLIGDYRRQPFPSISQCIPLCDDIIYPKGICTDCGGNSTTSYYSKQHTGNLKISTNNDFLPLCNGCYNKRI